MRFYKYFLPTIFTILLITSKCDKKIPITEFEDDFQEYKSEPRIEAVLNTTNLQESVVRIDRTILVTDTSLYDGRDNDGDWEGYEDLNGNGKWDEGEPLNDDIGDDIDGSEGGREPEGGRGDNQPTEGEPHVDELDEILPHIHDSSFTVTLYEKGSGEKAIDFKWTSNADQFTYIENPDTEVEETVTYGGYVPDKIYIDSIDYKKEYEFEFSKKDTTITGNVAPVPPAVFQDSPNATQKGDTLVFERNSMGKVIWETQKEASVYWIIVKRIYSPDSIEIVDDRAMISVAEDEDGNNIGKDFADLYAPGLYKWEVVVPSMAYAKYFYSNLPIRDKELNNLRDQYNNVVLGISGSVAISSTYVRVINGDE